MNEPLSITLLGGLQVQQGDRFITRFKSQKIGALLAYLAYHLPQMHSREILVERFWPESTLEAGRNSLSVALSTLRHQLEPPETPANAILRADRFSIGLNPAAVSTDIVRFEAAVQAAMKTENLAEQTQLLTAAADLYHGRLLPGFYDDWITAAQQHLAGLFGDTLNRLIGRLEANGDLPGALGYARRAVALDPLGEQADHHFIRLLAATGQSGAALRHYKEVEQRLDEELGEEPSAPLRALARQIEKQSGFALPLTLPATVFPQPLRPPPVFAPAPEGLVTLTFLLTDIEGSTQQWERTGGIFAQALASHHALLRHAFAQAGGQEINEAGDSFVVAFASAGKALNCAIAAQQALHEHVWPPETGALRVRMALHTGDVEFQEGTYHGLTLHRAARMLTTGHGGQILCSEATASLVRREPGEAVRSGGSRHMATAGCAYPGAAVPGGVPRYAGAGFSAACRSVRSGRAPAAALHPLLRAQTARSRIWSSGFGPIRFFLRPLCGSSL